MAALCHAEVEVEAESQTEPGIAQKARRAFFPFRGGHRALGSQRTSAAVP